MVKPVPFFIVGADRSGTTLLRLMLNQHSRLCIPPESHFIVDLVQEYKEEIHVDRVWDSLSRHPRYLEWELPDQLMREKVLQSSGEWAAIFDILFSAYAIGRGKVRWGDKTGAYVEHLRLLTHVFPGAKIIHLIRDGRDVACSLKEVPWSDGEIIDLARKWKRMVSAGQKDGLVLRKEIYLEVFYEKLVQEPIETLKKICHHIDEVYEENMLLYYNDAEDHIPEHRMAWHRRTKQPIDETRSQRWKTDLSPVEVRLFEIYAGSLLRELGYAINSNANVKIMPRLLCQNLMFWLAKLRRRMRAVGHKNNRLYDDN